MKIFCPLSFKVVKLLCKHLLVWSVTFSLLFPGVAPAFAQEPAPTIHIPQLSYPFDTTQHTPTITRSFGEHLSDASISAQLSDAEPNGHNGIDFDLPENTPIHPVDPGDIIFAGEKEHFGKTVIIQHTWGQSLYAHLAEVKIQSGHVEKTTEIALSGHTGEATGPHLHFGLTPLLPDESNGHFGFIDPSSYFANVSATDALPSEIAVEATASASLDTVLGAATTSAAANFVDNRTNSHMLR